MSFKLGGIVLEDLIIHSPEEKKLLADTGRPVPSAAREISLTEKMILMVFASFADDKGRNIYPSRKSAARQAGGCSVRTVERAIDKFLADGVLAFDEPVGRNGTPIRRRSRCYRIDVGKAVELYAERAATSDSMSEVDGAKKDSMSEVGEAKKDSMSDVAEKTQDTESEVGGGPRTWSPSTSDMESQNPIIEASKRRAREAGAAPEGAPASAREVEGKQLAAAIAAFKDALPAMREAVGEEGWNLIGHSLFVIGASPGHMLLGQPSLFLVDKTLEHREALERATGRTIEVVNRFCPERKGAA